MSSARVIRFVILALGGAASVLLAEPTDAGAAAGAIVSTAGLLIWWAAAAADSGAPEPDLGGIYAFIRHPRHAAAFLLACGIVVAAASDGKYGRWVARGVAPIWILYFFAHDLPRADALQRERLRQLNLTNAEYYLANVAPLVPSFYRCAVAPPAKLQFSRLLRFKNLFWIFAAALAFAGIFLQKQPGAFRIF